MLIIVRAGQSLNLIEGGGSSFIEVYCDQTQRSLELDIADGAIAELVAFANGAAEGKAPPEAELHAVEVREFPSLEDSDLGDDDDDGFGDAPPSPFLSSDEDDVPHQA